MIRTLPFYPTDAQRFSLCFEFASCLKPDDEAYIEAESNQEAGSPFLDRERLAQVYDGLVAQLQVDDEVRFQ